MNQRLTITFEYDAGNEAFAASMLPQVQSLALECMDPALRRDRGRLEVPGIVATVRVQSIPPELFADDL